MAEIVTMPRLSLNEQESLLAEWYIAQGDAVQEGDRLFCIETDKSTMDVYAPKAGVILKKLYGDGVVVEVLQPVCVIGAIGEEIPSFDEAPQQEQAPRQAAEPAAQERGQQAASTIDERAATEGARISPRAKRLAEANGVAYAQVLPTGAQGRVMETDVLRHLAQGGPVQAPPAAQEDIAVHKLTKIRRVIAANMLHSLGSTAQLTQTMTANISRLQACREQLKHEEKTAGVTLGDLYCYATIKALKQCGYVNALMPNEDEIHEYQAVHLGLAVDTERGLMVPTIFNADSLGILELSQTIKSVAAACRAGSIPPEQLKGGTFTISNLGGMGISLFTPILNPPQVGILGIGCTDYKIKKTEKGMLYYPACTLSLTYDHRAVDGGPAARFLQAICENINNISALLEGEAH
ncbi:MAG: 2-oxo acid dehydrogenase subunit E2 [Christensenellaceae bacterium]|jgi:pyruvate dehydrogenase E2 component (dihydrolipoamide acetyltransferase)|nr:2-oxo acid dehydrogenase subunit E2 [Christensenellaceae bacterium]